MQRLRSLPGVLYAEDFDLAPHRIAEPAADSDLGRTPVSDPAPPVAETMILEPTFSLVDLQNASSKAHEEGRSLEREELVIRLDARRTEAFCAIADALRQARSDCTRIAIAEATGLSRAVLAAVAAILPSLAARNGFAETAALLATLLPAMDGEPKLQIRAAPILLEQLRNDFATLPVAASVGMEWVAMDAMEPGDICVKWQDGMMLRDTRALCAQVVAMLFDALDQAASPSGKVC